MQKSYHQHDIEQKEAVYKNNIKCYKLTKTYYSNEDLKIVPIKLI